VRSAAECEALNPERDAFHGYSYDSASCTCFYWDDMLFPPEYCAEQDPRTPIENPLEGDMCISQVDYDSIFNHEFECEGHVDSPDLQRMRIDRVK